MRTARRVALICSSGYVLMLTVGLLLYPTPIGRLLAALAALTAIVALIAMLVVLLVSPSAERAQAS